MGFFSAANPTIHNGGFGMESKYDLYNLIPKKFSPKTLIFISETPLNDVKEAIAASQIKYPVIVKPDIGFQGKRVEKVLDETRLKQYLQACKFNFIVQELIEFPNEAGIFYCRYPNQAKGFITGMVYKEYPFVIGDGKSTLRDLTIKDSRLVIQAKLFKEILETDGNKVIQDGEIYHLSKIGNHARGTKFIDISNLISPALTNRIDSICKEIPSFYFGRLDIKYNQLDELAAGQKFSIIELNGAASLPTYMYDPKHSLYYAWKEMIKHFRILYDIAEENKKLGYKYLTIRELIVFVKQHIQYMKIISTT